VKTTRDWQSWLPEFIASCNLDGMKRVPGARVQKQTHEALIELANAMEMSVEDATRYAIEVGIAALSTARVL
jgi:hypothetical protein